MNKNSLFNLLLLFSCFFLFTKCQKEESIDMVHETANQTLASNPQMPDDAKAKLDELIKQGFQESEGVEDRCVQFPYKWGYVAPGFPTVVSGGCWQVCGGCFSYPTSWIYYHIDRKVGANYLNYVSGSVYDDIYSWNVSLPAANAYRGYVYIWEPICRKWDRVTERYFSL